MSVLLEEVIVMADEEKKPAENTEKDPKKDQESDEKVNDAEEKDANKKASSKTKESKEEEADDESSEEEERPGLYDKPLVIEGKRQRKKTEFLVKDQLEIKKKRQPLIFNGRGETLGSMEVVCHEISRCTALELKPLHKLLFGRDGRTLEIKKNIKAFNGFNFEEGSKEYENKKFIIERFTNEGLKRLLEILDLEKKGTRCGRVFVRGKTLSEVIGRNFIMVIIEEGGDKEDLKDRIYSFLMKPKGSGRTVPVKKKVKTKPKKKAASGKKRKRTPKAKSSEEVKDDDDDNKEDSEDIEAKKSSEEIKDDDDDNNEDSEDIEAKKSSEEIKDDDDDNKEDSEDIEPKKKKAKIEAKETPKLKSSPSKSKKVTSPIKATKETKKSGKKVDKKETKKPKKKESPKKETKKESKKTPKKSKPVTVKITAGKRTPKKSPKKVEKPADDDESSSDDEPLAKKIKKQPPNNDELAKVVKDLLRDADLDQVTVKSISKQVFSKYPEFDLSDKKAFIKETVYSVISGDAD